MSEPCPTDSDRNRALELLEGFRQRLRRFPLLVTCCTVNVIQTWPQEALSEVALHSLRTMDLGGGDDEGGVEVMADRCTQMCVHLHQSATRWAARYEVDHHGRAARSISVAPTCYSELLATSDAADM